MPIVIKGSDAAFQADVLSALETISGGRFAVDGDGQVVLDDPPSCADVCDHPVGSMLVEYLRGGSQTTYVEHSDNANSYVGYDNDDGQVTWVPGTNKTDINWCGNRRVTPPVVLAHELIHAYLDRTTGDFGGSDAGEQKVVRGENQIRWELCRPARLEYGGDPVPDYGSGLLPKPVAAPWGCSCYSSAADKVWSDLWCWLRIIARCLLAKYFDDFGDEDVEAVATDLYVHFYAAHQQSELGRRLEVALYTRSMSPHARQVDDVVALVRTEGLTGVLIENMGLAAENSASFTLQNPDLSIRLVTNMEFTPASEGFVAGPRSLIDHTFDPDEGFVPAVTQLVVQPGLNGRLDLAGGSVQLVTRFIDGVPETFGLYGFDYPPYDPGAVDPGPGPYGRRRPAPEDLRGPSPAGDDEPREDGRPEPPEDRETGADEAEARPTNRDWVTVVDVLTLSRDIALREPVRRRVLAPRA